MAWKKVVTESSSGTISQNTSGQAATIASQGTLATLSTVNADTITDNSVGAAELNVSGNGTSGQLLSSDGDGSFSWTSASSGGITGVTAGNGLTGGGSSGAVTLNAVGGDGITANADEIEASVDDSSIELSASDGTGVLQVKAGGVTNAMLAGSIADAKISSAGTWNAKQDALTFGKASGNALKSEEALASNDVLLMGVSHVKGRTYSEFKGDLSISSSDISDVDAFSQSGTYSGLRAQATTKGDVSLGNVENTALSTWAGTTNITTIGDATASSLTVTGDLDVQGTTTTIDSANLSVTDPHIMLNVVSDQSDYTNGNCAIIFGHPTDASGGKIINDAGTGFKFTSLAAADAPSAGSLDGRGSTTAGSYVDIYSKGIVLSTQGSAPTEVEGMLYWDGSDIYVGNPS